MKELLEMFGIMRKKTEDLLNNLKEYITLATAYSRYIKENYPDVHNKAIKEIENGND